MRSHSRSTAVVVTLSLGLIVAVPEAQAWPTTIMESLSKDARRLVPKSLAQLMKERETQILEEAWRFPPELSAAVAHDLRAGELSADTIAQLAARLAAVSVLFREGRVSEGVVRLGSLLRIPADLADPVLSAGAEGYPAGVTSEYYAFISANLDKIPVVLDDPKALELPRRGLGPYWRGVLGRSRAQSPVIRVEMFQKGRVISHRYIDYRSPVFGVASLSYSRAVTAIAATWLAVWRDAKGDITRIAKPKTVAPVNAPPSAVVQRGGGGR